MAKQAVSRSGQAFGVDAYTPLHVRGGHADVQTEKPRGQRPVTAADYARLPELLNGAHTTTYVGTAKSTGAKLVEIEGVIDGERYVTKWEVRGKRRSLTLKTFFIFTKKQP
ncbi:MAG TPA: hypothetical protein VFN13_09910 [Rudaea sp.]|nr:hypothetical protein [Rudaea sp.]